MCLVSTGPAHPLSLPHVPWGNHMQRQLPRNRKRRASFLPAGPVSKAAVHRRPPPPPSKAGPHGRFRLEAEEHLLLPTEYGVISGLSSLSDQQAWTMRTLLLGNSRNFLIYSPLLIDPTYSKHGPVNKPHAGHQTSPFCPWRWEMKEVGKGQAVAIDR